MSTGAERWKLFEKVKVTLHCKMLIPKSIIDLNNLTSCPGGKKIGISFDFSPPLPISLPSFWAVLPNSSASPLASSTFAQDCVNLSCWMQNEAVYLRSTVAYLVRNVIFCFGVLFGRDLLPSGRIWKCFPYRRQIRKSGLRLFWKLKLIKIFFSPL